MNPIFKLLGIEKLIAELNNNIEINGWYKANKKYIADLKIKVKATFSGFPKKGAVLIYANHITGLDPFILSSVIERDDVYILTDVYQTKKGVNIEKHLLPVYYSSLMSVFQRSGIAFFGYIVMRILTGTESKEKAKLLNQATISNAVAHLNEGHIVIIFPSGGNKKNEKWRKGIGEIILRSYRNNINYILYKSKISSFSEYKLIWHLLIDKHYLVNNPIKVIGEIIEKNSFKHDSSVIITAHLQNTF